MWMELTTSYELDKYLAPGALFVFLVWILPGFLLFGAVGTSTAEVGVLVLVSYVVGQLLEALKVYDWPRRSRDEFEHFKERITDLLVQNGIKDAKQPEQNARVRALLFTVLHPSTRSELSWNLVRWQKMMVFYCLFLASSVLWLLVLILGSMEKLGGIHLLRSQVSISILNTDLPFRVHLISELLFISFSLGLGFKVYSNGLERQKKNNNTQYALIVEHFQDIRRALDSTANRASTDP